MLRICMVLHHCEKPFGGPELQALRLAELFVSDGHQVVIIARGSGHYPDYEEICGIPVYRLNHPGLASIEVFRILYMLRNSFDIIHVHGTGRLTAASILFAKHFHKKVFVKATMNKGIVKEIKQGTGSLLKKLKPFAFKKIDTLKKANAIIAITQDIVADLQRHGFQKNKISYIPNGVDTKIFYPLSLGKKFKNRSQLNLPNDKIIFAFTGKITKRKGIDILLEAWQKTKKVKKEALLIVIGSGIGEKDSLEDFARKFVKEHDLTNTVRFIGSIDNVADYLQASDVFVFPSRWEGLPNSLLEAMATGLLCIASDIAGVNEIIIPGETGVLTAVEDSTALGLALDEAYQNQTSELGMNAASLIQQKFGIETTKRKLEELFIEKIEK